MARKNFFEMMEREIDFQNEYEKIENILLNKRVKAGKTLDDLIELQFKNWKYRQNYTSFWELRCKMDFTYYQTDQYPIQWETDRKDVKLADFLLYVEMVLNMFSLLHSFSEILVKETINLVIETIRYDLEKINHEVTDLGDGHLIVTQKDAAAAAVADIVEPDLAKAVIQYNHHLLKHDLGAKKEILKRMADALEPKRSKLKAANSTLESDFFMLVNKMNIRHNNCDPEDRAKYVEPFAKLTPRQKENWYDDIYQEGLMAFLTLEQVERNKRIADFKALF